MARTRITITLELEDGPDGSVESPTGSARLPDGTSRTFQGWIGLAEAIDALARAPRGALPDAATGISKETP